MAAEDNFEGELPKELRMHLDFVSNIVIVLFAFGLRRLGLIDKDHVPGLRAAAFIFTLPALFLRLLWGANLGQGALYVVFFSYAFHALWILASLTVARLAQPLNKGFYAMAVIGSGTPFAYPAILSSSRFSDQAATAAIMWDISGVTAINIVYYAVIGQIFAPPKNVEDSETEKHIQQPEGAIVGASSVSEEPQIMSVVPSTAESSQICVEVPTAGAGSISIPMNHSAGVPWRSIGIVVAQNPVIWAMLLGLLLNMTGVPRYPIPSKSLNVLASSFPPMLYALVGANLRFDIGWSSYGVIFRALAARWLLCIMFALLLRVPFLPFDAETRGVLTLCVLTPIPGMFIMYTGKYGYRGDQAAVLYNLAAVLSMCVISFLTPVV